MKYENMKYDSLKLKNQACFSLYACSKELIRLYKPILDEFNITYTQYITLLVLWEEDDILVKDLGSKLLLASNTLTPLLKKIENVGLIERRRDKNDERNVYIKLTEKGIEMKEKALKIPEEIISKTGITEEEVTDLKVKLDAILIKLIDA